MSLVHLLSAHAFAFTLTVPTTVEPGDVVRVDVQGARANETLTLALSPNGVGAGPCGLGVCLGILAPVQSVGTLVVDGRGNGSATFTVPAQAPIGATFGLQAVAPRGGVQPELSNAVAIDVLGTCSTVEAALNGAPTFDDGVSMGGPDLLFAMRFQAPSDLTVARVEVFTGEVVGPSSVELWTDVGGLPGAPVAGGDWSVAQANGWQGANLDRAVTVPAGSEGWVVWAPPSGAQAPWDSAGADLVDYTASWDGGLTWGTVYTDRLKVRALSCP